jgi:hypothetical protein
MLYRSEFSLSPTVNPVVHPSNGDNGFNGFPGMPDSGAGLGWRMPKNIGQVDRDEVDSSGVVVKAAPERAPSSVGAIEMACAPTERACFP